MVKVLLLLTFFTRDITKIRIHMPDTQWGQTTAKCQFGAEKHLLGALQGYGGPCLQNPQVPESSHQRPFLGKLRGGAGELLQNSWGSDPLFLKWAQSSGNNSPVNLHQTNVISCSDKKGPKSWLSLSEVQSWLREGKAHLVAPSGPGPQTPSSCHGRGSQAPRTKLALRFLRMPKWQGPGP